MELIARIVLTIDEEKLANSDWSMERLQTYFTHVLETNINDQMPDLFHGSFIQTQKKESV